MKPSAIVSIGVLLTIASTLAGCASLPEPDQQYAYYVVPCDTPGAILTGTATPAAPVADAAAMTHAVPAAPVTPASPVCIVAATQSQAYASARGYPSAYYPRGYYAYPAFNSFSLAYHGGGRGHNAGRGHGGGGGHRGGHGGGHGH